jgi:hypothetical protein
MPAPTFTDGTVGNVLNAVSVAKGATIAAFLDLSTTIEGQLALDVQAGATPPTVATAFSAYKAQAAYHSGTPVLTLGAAVTAGTASTTLTVASQNATTGLRAGEQIALVSQSTLVGELVTITSVAGSGPYTVGITGAGANSGTLNNYSASPADYVFVMVQTPTSAVTPTIPAANKGNSAPLYLGTGRYVVAASNPDAAQGVTVTVTLDRVPSYA